jgi:hypothetical protein
MTHVTLDELIEFVRSHGGELKLETQQQKHPFTVRLAGDAFEYLPRSNKPRTHDRAYLQRVCDESSRTNSVRPVDYNDITMNASYTLALI